MPSLNRPNAPDRLPSADFGNLFFKPRALRTPDANITPSPLSSPANLAIHRRKLRSSEGDKSYSQSPLASPGAVTVQRRQQHAERPIYLSETSTRSGLVRESPRHSPHILVAAEEELTPRKPPSIANDERTPGEARAGFRWTRDFLGGWLEIRVGRQRGSDEEEHNQEPPRSEFEEASLPSITASTLHLPRSHATSIEESAGHASGHPQVSDTPDSLDSDSVFVFKEGLYCRTKRALGLKHGPITPHLEPRSRTPTGAILDRVTSTLRGLPTRTSTVSTSTATSVSNLSIAAPRRRRQRPGHRSGWSASSSVGELILGKPPVGTPEPEAVYTGSDSQTYLAVDLSQPEGPAFLPSEARRINTPPLPAEGSGKSHLRGFFFDYNPPDNGDRAILPRRTLPPPQPVGSVRTSKEGDWYRVQLDTIEISGAASYQQAELDVPEHFPNSPLCPNNLKHQSGGTGTCPYHGRNKSTPSDNEQTPTPSKTGTLSPEPESWWLK